MRLVLKRGKKTQNQPVRWCLMKVQMVITIYQPQLGIYVSLQTL